MSSARFGVGIDAQLHDWWRAEGKAEFHRRYGADAVFSGYILDPAQRRSYDWRDPLQYMLHHLTTGEGVRYTNPRDGLNTNVVGKLRFVLRTRLDSVNAETRLDLLEPGDFPWEGAVWDYRGYCGGGSGLDKKSDRAAFEWLVDKLIELRTAAAQPVFDSQRAKVPGFRYMGGDPWTPLTRFLPDATSEEEALIGGSDTSQELPSGTLGTGTTWFDREPASRQ